MCFPMCADECCCSPNVFYRLVPPLRTLKVTPSFPAKDTWAHITDNNACTCASMVLFTDMLQHLRNCRCYLFLLNVSMICGSQNIMRYDIMALCKLRYCLIIDFLSSRKRPGGSPIIELRNAMHKRAYKRRSGTVPICAHGGPF